MVALFGVRLGGLSMGIAASRLVCCATLLAGAGCEGGALIVGQERPRPGSSDDEGGGPDGVEGAPPPDVTLVEDCPPTPGERRELLGCWPTPHLGAWRGFFTGIPRYETADGAGAEFPTGDVRLLLGVDGAGLLTFGVPPAIASAALERSVPACGAPAAPMECERPGLVIPGFTYRLEEISLYDRALERETRIEGEAPLERPESMDFRVRVGEPWDAWCSEQTPEDGTSEARCRADECEKGQRPAPPAAIESAGGGVAGCRCDADGCRPEAASLFIELDMSGDQKSLRGSYTPGDARLGQARLEFRKELDP